VLDMSWMVNLRAETWLDEPRTSTSAAKEWWTGLPPESCPGIQKDGTMRSLPMLDLKSATRKDVLDYFDNTWTLTEVLFAGLHTEEPFFRPPVHGLRHPLIFYYGHVACLYVNKLRISGALSGPVNEYFESILETGVDEMSWDDMHKNDMVWPTVQAVKDYRAEVYSIMKNMIETHPELDENAPPLSPKSELWALVMGFEHERIHLETSSVLIREMPHHLVRAPQWWPKPHDSHLDSTRTPPPNAMVEVPAGTVVLGKPDDFPTFGWDNEYGHREVHVPAFSASKFMVSNNEFHEFVKDGGYTVSDLWSSEGWGWRHHRNAKWPFFWQQDGPSGLHQYKLRTIFDAIDLPKSWPAEVNYHEATAYAKWKSASSDAASTGMALRMITEAEHNRLRGEDALPGTEFSGNTNLKHGSGTPVDMYEPSPTGHYDVMGNNWEWTEDDFNPLDNFEVHPIYTDFSTPCFDGRHSMIMGSSFVSTGDMSTHFARFHFRPHFLQHSGFRLTQSSTPAPATLLGNAESDEDNVYESEEMVQQYLLLHYGDADATFRSAQHETNPVAAVGFPQRCAAALSAAYSEHADIDDPSKPTVALDIGCAVGGATMELTRSFDSALGVDMSQAFVDTAREVQSWRDKPIAILPPQEGNLRVGEPSMVSLDQELDLSRASFRVGDACNLDAQVLGGPFDAVLMANLLCRVPDPGKALKDMSQANNGLGIVRKGGLLMLVSPFSWSDQFTDEARWLGGKQGAKDSFAGVEAALGDHFQLVDRMSLPLVIREHRRRWQYIVPDAAIFKRVM
jgi:5-histidylcysteine sulfoxide synthase